MDRVEIRTGRPSKKQAEGLNDHVVAVADALFGERGYSATSMAMVAAQARVGKQTLYRRFPDKATLFREVIRRRIDAIVPPQAGTEAGCDPLAELKSLGRSTLDVVLDPEFVRLYRIIIGEALSFPELASAASDNFGSSLAQRCVEAIEKAQATNVLRLRNSETLAHSFIWSLIGDALLKGLSGVESSMTKRERDAHLEAVWRLVLEGALIG